MKTKFKTLLTALSLTATLCLLPSFSAPSPTPTPSDTPTAAPHSIERILMSISHVGEDVICTVVNTGMWVDNKYEWKVNDAARSENGNQIYVNVGLGIPPASHSFMVSCRAQSLSDGEMTTWGTWPVTIYF